MSTSVVLDANILYPFLLRDIILYAAHFDLFRPIWSDMILEEVERNLVQNDVMEVKNASKLLQQMRKVFPDAKGAGFETLIPIMPNDPKDRHVMALAVHEEASILVTNNTKDFHPTVGGIEILSADEFLLGLLTTHSEEMVAIIRIQVSKYKNPPVSQEELLGYYEKQVPIFTQELRRILGGC